MTRDESMASSASIRLSVSRGAQSVDDPSPPNGFKQTEIGSIPEEWEVANIGSLFDIQQGKAISARKRTGKSLRPFLRTANVFWGRLDLSTVDTMDFTDQEAEKLSLRIGDLLVCEGGDIGRTAMWRDEIEGCSHQNHVHRLRAKITNVEPMFYMYWMQAAMLLLRLYGGEGNKTTIPNLSKARLSTFQVPIPPLPEQRAIAHVLSKIQAAAEAQAAIAGRARELKRALMARLFTEGLRGEPLKETEIGPMPEGWEVAPLGDCVTQAQYGLSVRGEESGKYPILRMTNQQNGVIVPANLQHVNISENELAKFKVNRGELLFNRTNSMELVGRTAIFDLEEDYVFASYLIRVAVIREKLEPHFLNFYLNDENSQARLKGLATRGVSQSNISASRLRTFIIPVPSLDEQREIARILQTVDAKIASAERKRARLEELFRAMLGQLMTGRVRAIRLPLEST
ncbi:MAG TPA: restriction endonuclease subunit S [Anaerolineales bacterium]|nr:restriction endonuclease subunit S [Anaerolineales bacterium]